MSIAKFTKWQSLDGVTRNAVLQVVSKEVTTTTQTTSETFVDATDMFLAITPTSATSKIMCLFDIHLSQVRASNLAYTAVRVNRNGTTVFFPYTTNATGSYSVGGSAVGATNVFFPMKVPLIFLDSPNTTNEVTYQLQLAVYENANSGSSSINATAAGSSTSLTSTITLMEIAQ